MSRDRIPNVFHHEVSGVYIDTGMRFNTHVRLVSALSCGGYRAHIGAWISIPFFFSINSSSLESCPKLFLSGPRRWTVRPIVWFRSGLRGSSSLLSLEPILPPLVLSFMQLPAFPRLTSFSFSFPIPSSFAVALYYPHLNLCLKLLQISEPAPWLPGRRHGMRSTGVVTATFFFLIFVFSFLLNSLSTFSLLNSFSATVLSSPNFPFSALQIIRGVWTAG